MWKIKIKNKNQTLWTKKVGLDIRYCNHSEREKNGYCPHCETGTKDLFVDVRKMFTHGGYNPKSAWYVFLPDNKSDLNADYVFTSRLQAEKKAKAYMWRIK